MREWRNPPIAGEQVTCVSIEKRFDDAMFIYIETKSTNPSITMVLQTGYKDERIPMMYIKIGETESSIIFDLPRWKIHSASEDKDGVSVSLYRE